MIRSEEVDFYELEKIACKAFGVPLSEYKANYNSKKNRYVYPRFVVYHIANKMSNEISYTNMGKWTGGKTHATVLNGIAKVNDTLMQYANFRDAHNIIFKEAKSKKLFYMLSSIFALDNEAVDFIKGQSEDNFVMSIEWENQDTPIEFINKVIFVATRCNRYIVSENSKLDELEYYIKMSVVKSLGLMRI